MNSKLRISFMVLALTVILSANASGADGAQYYPYVTRIEVAGDNYLWIGVKTSSANNTVEGFVNGHGCSSPNETSVTTGWMARSAYPLTDERTKAWLSMAITSLSSGRKVYVSTMGCTLTPTSGFPIINRLQLAPYWAGN